MTAIRQDQMIREGVAEPILEIVPIAAPKGDAGDEEIRVAVATDLGPGRDLPRRIIARGAGIEVVGTACEADGAVLRAEGLRAHANVVLPQWDIQREGA
jgi:hypothetical protein